VEILNSLTSSLWSILLIAVFFGGSIFVHELGHFLAARRRGVLVERFSIGFGPKIFSWKGKDGVEYRLSWLPLGGYVALPQLADMRSIEGAAKADLPKHPSPGYATRMIVFGAGAFFNILFALALACIIWTTGLPTSNEQSTTRIGYVVDQLTTSEGQRVRSPASEAGLRIGDTVRAIDGRKTETWQELMQVLLTSAGRTTEGQREALFTIEREGKLIEVVVHPVIAGNEKDRRVGIAPGYELIVHGTTPKSLAAAAGFLADDRLVSLDGIAILNIQTYGEILARSTEREIHAVVQRGTTSVNLVIPARTAPKDPSDFGLTFTTERTLIYPNPLKQIGDVLGMTYHTFASLINPQSDVGISKLSGPVGIARVFHLAAQADIRYVIWFTILVNINLAVFNLLPIPVLDGGHMLFATIGKLLGRPLPASFVATAQSVFMILLFSMVIYVSFFDVRRWSREARAERAEQSVPAK
jgi:regulator of sigma E protease